MPVEEYIEIVNSANGTIDAVLGGSWYADSGGVMEKKVFRDIVPERTVFTVAKMDFDNNEKEWKEYEDPNTVQAIDAHCRSLGIPFFMKSHSMINWLRNQRND